MDRLSLWQTAEVLTTPFPFPGPTWTLYFTASNTVGLGHESSISFLCHQGKVKGIHDVKRGRSEWECNSATCEFDWVFTFFFIYLVLFDLEMGQIMFSSFIPTTRTFAFFLPEIFELWFVFNQIIRDAPSLCSGLLCPPKARHVIPWRF